MAYLAPLRRECLKKLPVKERTLALLEGATLGAWRAPVERGGEIPAVGLMLCMGPQPIARSEEAQKCYYFRTLGTG